MISNARDNVTFMQSSLEQWSEGRFSPGSLTAEFCVVFYTPFSLTIRHSVFEWLLMHHSQIVHLAANARAEAVFSHVFPNALYRLQA